MPERWARLRRSIHGNDLKQEVGIYRMSRIAKFLLISDRSEFRPRAPRIMQRASMRFAWRRRIASDFRGPWQARVRSLRRLAAERPERVGAKELPYLQRSL